MPLSMPTIAALQMLAETSKEVIPQMERIAQSPTVAVESVTKLAESLVAQNQGIVAAIELGTSETCPTRNNHRQVRRNDQRFCQTTR